MTAHESQFFEYRITHRNPDGKVISTTTTRDGNVAERERVLPDRSTEWRVVRQIFSDWHEHVG